MKIRYELTLDDLIAFNRYHIAHSPALRLHRAARTFVTWVVPVGLVVASLQSVASLPRDKDPAALAGTLIGLFIVVVIVGLACLTWVWLIPRFFTWSIDRQVRRMLREGKNKGVVGTHDLELTENRLIARTAYNESATNLEALERVVTTDDHAFIYMSAVGAHVIPRRAVTEGDYRRFLEAVAEAACRGTPPGGKISTVKPVETEP